MTDEQIKQNAEAYADVFGRHMVDYYGVIDAYIAGAHSRDEEIEELRKHDALENKMRIDLINECEQLKQELYQLRNPWISVEEGLPKKALGLYELEEDERHKMVLFKTANGKRFIGYLDAEEIWRAFTVPYSWACPIDSFTQSRVTHWMPIPQIKKGE